MDTKVALPVQSKFSEEVAEWIEAFDDVVVGEGPEQGAELIAALRHRAREAGISTPGALTTPYLNTIPKHEEVPYPGNRELELRLEALIRWNAMAMVHGQNKKDAGIGGHPAGSGLRAFLPRHLRGPAGRLYLFSRPRFPGCLCACLPRRTV